MKIYRHAELFCFFEYEPVLRVVKKFSIDMRVQLGALEPEFLHSSFELFSRRNRVLIGKGSEASKPLRVLSYTLASSSLVFLAMAVPVQHLNSLHPDSLKLSTCISIPASSISLNLPSPVSRSALTAPRR